MKKILTLAGVTLLFIVAFSFQSCEKCITCKYTYVVNGETRTFEYPELCGDNEDINDLEDLCEAEAGALAGDCSCD